MDGEILKIGQVFIELEPPPSRRCRRRPKLDKVMERLKFKTAVTSIERYSIFTAIFGIL